MSRRYHNAGTRWQNVPGTCVREIVLDDDTGEAFDCHTEKTIPFRGFVDLIKPNHSYELIIEFFSSGCDVPASKYGGFDHLGWEAEREDERELDRAYLQEYGPGLRKLGIVEIPEDVQRELFEFYADAVQDSELEPPHFED